MANLIVANMGVIYKLKSEIKEWIAEQKRANPALSCRSCQVLVEKQFSLQISKSSINAIFKQIGLSMPRGRTNKKVPKIIVSTDENLPCQSISTKTLLPPSSAEALKNAVKPLLSGPVNNIPALPILPAEPQPILEAPVKQVPQETPESRAHTPPVAQPQEQIIASTSAQQESDRCEIPLLASLRGSEATEAISNERLLRPFGARNDSSVTIPDMALAQKQILSCGAILLKAMDYLINGTAIISELTSRVMGTTDNNLIPVIERALYAPILGIAQEERDRDLEKLSPAANIFENIVHRLIEALTQVRCIKILLDNNEDLYIDAQAHTVWSVSNIPYDFDNTLYDLKKIVNGHFYAKKPLVLFAAPGYDAPTNEFLDLLSCYAGIERKMVRVSLYDDRLNELESLHLEENRPGHLVFGVWPWQFVQYRKVKKIGEFKPFFFYAENKNIYAADIEIEIFSADKSRSFALRGYALKSSITEKTRLIILTTLPEESIDPNGLIELYLKVWPNGEEAFQDLSRKVELFTYTAESAEFFSAERLKLPDKINIDELLNYYLLILDMYFRWHFLPSGYEKKDLVTCCGEFYKLRTTAELKNDSISVTFHTPQNQSSFIPLQYACRRLNERMITLDGKRLLFIL